MTRVGYRIWQLWRALTGRLSADEHVYAQQTLTPAEYALFVRMPSLTSATVWMWHSSWGGSA